MGERFRDPQVDLHGLAAGAIHVVCPRCRGRAIDARQPTDDGPASMWNRRLVCTRCGYTADNNASLMNSRWGGPIDPFFRVPLWLRAACCGRHTLWAFNGWHLDVLEDYVRATLRERGEGPSCGIGMTMVAQLPTWLKSAKHRAEVLRVIGRLRARLAEE